MRLVDVPPDALVIRFSPWSPERVHHRAGLAARRGGYWTSSVFAALQADEESDEDVRRRLLYASELHEIHPWSNDKFAVCDRAQRLLEMGFAFAKDDYPAEAAEHYSVYLGVTPTIEDVGRFLSAFRTRQRRPPWHGSRSI